METEYYKVSGRFEVYDECKTLITDQLFVNKIFEAFFPAAAKNMAVAYAKKRAVRKYGKETKVKQAGNLVVRKSHEPAKKRKKRIDSTQGKLF